MIQGRFEKNELEALLSTISKKQGTGCLRIVSEQSTPDPPLERIIFFNNGWITHAGLKAPTIEFYTRILSRRLKRSWASVVAQVDPKDFAGIDMQSTGAQNAFLGRLVHAGVFSWNQILLALEPHVLLVLERLLPQSGTFSFKPSREETVTIGFQVWELLKKVATRQQQLVAVAPYITSLDNVLAPNGTPAPQSVNPAYAVHYKKFQQLLPWIDGQRSVLDLAELRGEDSLVMAYMCAFWVKAGWLCVHRSPGTSQDHTIVAIDDSAVMLELIKRSLKKYRVLTAQKATEGIALIFHEKPNLIVLDVSMPELDGLQLCSTIRNVESFKQIPIVMLTARDGFFDKIKGRIAGSTEYLTKPFDGEKLCEVVDKHLQLGPSTYQTSALQMS